MKTLEDLHDDLALWHEEAAIWMERRDDHDRERHIAHMKFIQACREADKVREAIIAANGEAS